MQIGVAHRLGVMLQYVGTSTDDSRWQGFPVRCLVY